MYKLMTMSAVEAEERANQCREAGSVEAEMFGIHEVAAEIY